MTVHLEDILKLDEILKPCVELSSLSLRLITAERNDALRPKLANDLSLLIGHHPTLKRLVLGNFQDLLVGYWDKYRLPTSLETLVLCDSVLMRVDLEHGTDASTTSHIRDLTILNYEYRYFFPFDVEGYLKFVESHAETLVSLDIDLSIDQHQPTVDRLKHMAEHLAKFNKLQRFRYRVQNVDDILEILLHVMPLIAVNQSLNSYTLIADRHLSGYDGDFLQSLQLAMKKICIGRERLLDFAELFFFVEAEFYDCIPIFEYEDICNLVGYMCHPRGVCEYDTDIDFDHGIHNAYNCKYDMNEDFQDGIPIGEYEDKCEVVGYQCQLPDDYDCEHDMDDFPISKYEAAFILVNMKNYWK